MRKAEKDLVPAYHEMIEPTMVALQQLGGSGTIEEINNEVAQNLNLSSEVLEIPHGDSTTTEFAYRLAWSRTYLKKAGLVDNSARGVWSLTALGAATPSVQSQEIVRIVREQANRKNVLNKSVPQDEAVGNEVDQEIEWQDAYRKALLAIDPSAFERLVQRMLRESGFTKVEVTGRSGDGGIDGYGIARINGFLSFQIYFQCKRYKGSVSAGDIRDFRGAMQGRTDKGLFVTTGTFTREAVREASRDGAPPIDLLDGSELVERLKELRLGVKVEMAEVVTIDEIWLKGL